MSKSVDERIVEMRINNQQFEKGAKESISTLERLKKSLNLEGADKNLKKLEQAGKEFSLEGMAKDIDLISSRFTTMGIIGTRVLTNIADSAIRTGRQMISALTLDAPKLGFSEYETQINAIQTILANTQSKGTSLDQINEALDELNRYADLTIYNFTQMTESIGRFTATGLNLDISTASIKGLSNLAAMAGSTAMQLNTAMYQLSQGLSAGVIKLQDWNSLLTANLTNESFRESLMETARVHGIAIDEMIAKYGSLEYTLQEGWLSSEVMMETLLKFTGDYSAAEWEAIGYTKEQAAAIVELGKTAMGAATDVKTFTQLIDTTKEALQSGWTQTWEIIVGDFEEAKKLWSDVSEVLSNIINESANSRNSMLETWKELGGRTDIIQSLSNIFQALVNVITPVRDAFREVFPPMTGEQLASISQKFRELTEILLGFTEKLEFLKPAWKGTFSIIKNVIDTVVAALTPIGKLAGVVVMAIGSLSAVIGEFSTQVVNAISASGAVKGIFSSISSVIDRVSSSVSEFVEGLSSGLDSSQFAAFGSSVSAALSQVVDMGSKSAIALEGFKNSVVGNIGESSDIFETLGSIVGTIGSKISSVAISIKDALVPIGEKIQVAFEGVTFADLLGAGSLTAMAVGIGKFVNAIKQPLNDLSESISGTLETVGNVLTTWQKNIRADTLMTIAKAVLLLTASLIGMSFIDAKKLGPGLAGVSALFAEVTAALIILDKMKVSGSMKASATVVALAGAVAIMAAALASLQSFTNIKQLKAPLAGIAGIAAVLVVTVGVLSKLDAAGLIKSSVTILTVSGAISILANALIKMESIDATKIQTSLIVLGGVLLELAVFLKIVTSANLSGVATTLVSFAVSLFGIVAAVNLLGSMDPVTLVTGLIAVSAALISLGGAIRIMNTANLKGVAASLLALSTSMLVLVGAVAAFGLLGSISWTSLATGLLSVISLMLVMSKSIGLMGGTNLGMASLAIAALAAALTLLTVPITVLGALPWQVVAGGILSILAALAVVGVVATLMAPFAAGMLAVSAALALLGATCLAIGAGVTLLGTGMALLATSAVAGAAALLAAVPVIGAALEEFLSTALQVIQNVAPAIMETIAILIQSLLETLVAYGPSIAAAAWELFKWLLHGLTVVAGELLTALWELLQQIGGAIADFFQPMFEAGQNLVQGLIDGIVSMPGKIADAAKNLGNSILTKIKDVLGIHSPSEETYSDGVNVVKGLVNGVTSGYGSTEKAAAGLGSSLQNGSKKSLKELLSQFSSAGASAGTSFSKSAGTAIKKEKSPEEKAKKKAQEIKDAFEKELKSTEFDTEQLDLEFDIWEAQTKKTVKAQDYYTKKKEYINKKIEYQTTVTSKAEEKYRKMVETFGESSEYAREAYNDWLTEQKELTELGNDLADLTDETVQKINDAYDKMNKTLENRANKLDLQEQLADSLSYDPTQVEAVSPDIFAQNVTKAENEYRQAVFKFGKDSDEAVAAYEKLEQARANYSRNQDGVFDAELEYKRAVKEYGEDSKEALAAYEAYQTAISNSERRQDYSSDLDSQLSALEERESYYKDIVEEFGEDSEEAAYAALMVEQAQADLDTAQNQLNANARNKAFSNFTTFIRSMGKYGTQAEKASNALAKYNELLNTPGVDQDTLDEAYNDYLQEQVDLLGIVNDYSESAGLGEGASTALSVFAKALGDNWPLVTDKWEELIGDLGPILEDYNIDSSVIDFIKKIFENPSLETVLSEGLSFLIKNLLTGDNVSGILSILKEGLKGLIEKVLPGIAEAFSGGDIIGAIGKVLSGGLTKLLPGLAELFSGGGGLATVVTSLGEGLTTLLGGAGASIMGLVETVGGGLMALASSLGPVGIAIAAVAAILVGLFVTCEDFRNFVINAFKGIGDVIMKVFNLVKNTVGKAFEAIYKVVKSVIDAIWGFVEKIQSVIEGIMDFLGNLSFPNIFGGGGGGGGGSDGEKEGANVGASIVNGIIQGITNPIGTVINAVGSIGSAVVNGFKNFFGIHSPSKVFAGLGGQLIDGLVVGLDKSTPEAVKSIDTFGAVVDEQMTNLMTHIDDIAEPTIRPVLDTSNVANGMRSMSSLFSRNSSVKLSGNASVARDAIASADASRETQNGVNSATSTVSTGSTYSFVQNNYSPKALSKSEIYRQTRNQFSMLKGRA